MTAPSTVTGKVLLVFYGLLGCSAAILFFNLFLERVITLLTLLMFRCHKRRRESAAGEGDGDEEWKPSVYLVTLILFVAVLLVACGAASLYSAMEGWTYLESLYFCFVAFSTVGFGDFVSSQRQHHEDTKVYQVANCLLMLLGVCCTYSLLNAVSVIIKQGLHCVMTTLLWMYDGVCRYRLCFSEPEPPKCFCEDSTRHRRHVQVSSTGHSMVWRSCVPSSIGKCLCDEAKVETVCHRHEDTGTSGKQAQESCSYEKNVVYSKPPLRLTTCLKS